MTIDLQANDSTSPTLDLVSRVEELLQRQVSNPRQRMLVALAGVPGSGKSTVSHDLIQALARRGIGNVSIVPMDGFHHTKKVLSQFDDPENAFRRRGAPFTFDAEAFVGLVKTLKTAPVTINDEPDQPIYAPSFDHAIQDPVENDIALSSRDRLAIVEGNYTLLDQKPWSEVTKYCDEKSVLLTETYKRQELTSIRWFVDVPLEIVRDRLAARHLAAGIETSYDAAVQRAETNDIPNGDLIRSLLIKPDVTIYNQ
ncbi:putative kinase [Curvularia kusanoi]|uniref:Kinase n=1 Tax=Curvularia kusanoi TaxID=90978 RepID=A0A9P4W8Z5_CURKU|nr:putative kinase [Curvularia kusanoi]